MSWSLGLAALRVNLSARANSLSVNGIFIYRFFFCVGYKYLVAWTRVTMVNGYKKEFLVDKISQSEGSNKLLRIARTGRMRFDRYDGRQNGW